MCWMAGDATKIQWSAPYTSEHFMTNTEGNDWESTVVARKLAMDLSMWSHGKRIDAGGAHNCRCLVFFSIILWQENETSIHVSSRACIDIQFVMLAFFVLKLVAVLEVTLGVSLRDGRSYVAQHTHAHAHACACFMFRGNDGACESALHLHLDATRFVYPSKCHIVAAENTHIG